MIYPCLIILLVILSPFHTTEKKCIPANNVILLSRQNEALSDMRKAMMAKNLIVPFAMRHSREPML